TAATGGAGAATGSSAATGAREGVAAADAAPPLGWTAAPTAAAGTSAALGPAPSAPPRNALGVAASGGGVAPAAAITSGSDDGTATATRDSPSVRVRSARLSCRAADGAGAAAVERSREPPASRDAAMPMTAPTTTAIATVANRMRQTAAGDRRYAPRRRSLIVARMIFP